MTTMDLMNILVAISTDLTSALSAGDRYQRLLASLKRAIPYDAATLMRVREDSLLPIASIGLSADAMGRRYLRKDHPRLDIICKSESPLHFPSNSLLPDPFDGLLINGKNMLAPIHSCLGCPLFADNKLIGILTVDALSPNKFEQIDEDFLSAVSALAGAQLQTTNLIEALELSAQHQGHIVSELLQDIQLYRGKEIIGSSPVIKHLKREISLVARSDYTVLVLGETGVGKELVARAIHAASNRRDKPILYLNCAALPETLADSELFGHIQGAYTGASRNRLGKFEVADEGTLFLDEIGELPLSVQAKLLRVIQEGEIQRVGSDKTTIVNVRLLAATNRDLEMEVKAGRFREDLYHRLNVYPIRVPTLRERTEDIQLLSGFFCEQTQHRLGLGPVRIDQNAMAILIQYAWPGNVRELENVLSRAILKASVEHPRGQTVLILPGHLGGDLVSEKTLENTLNNETFLSTQNYISLRTATLNFQKQIIESALRKNQGSWAATGRALDMNRSNLYNLGKRLGITNNREP